MTDNVLKMPTQEPPKFIIGPFTEFRVLIEGRVIPGLTAHEHDDGSVDLIVDGRFVVTFPKEIAHRAAWLLAQALAVRDGYPSLAAETKDRPFAPQGFEVTP